MSDSEARAYDRSEAGSGPTPVYEGPNKAAIEGWRLHTPPIVAEIEAAEDEEE